MAATIARAIGRSKDRETEASRLGPESAEAQANTFKTFTTCTVFSDGSGSVKLERTIEGRRVTVFEGKFGAEDHTDETVMWVSGQGSITGGNRMAVYGEGDDPDADED